VTKAPIVEQALVSDDDAVLDCRLGALDPSNHVGNLVCVSGVGEFGPVCAFVYVSSCISHVLFSFDTFCSRF